ncbi:Uu.00g009120.m01.CDS01 [Anthostomella pinea]|uniref:Uu.00g009120.m01.CDS01 n=1 Tax=Anthostomella pinea TaxID=933095 RepID=A0AAI8VYJ9_9PEZI|nr:Uu.00g009120.m01.CDS01 [Anthostomella pinea]
MLNYFTTKVKKQRADRASEDKADKQQLDKEKAVASKLAKSEAALKLPERRSTSPKVISKPEAPAPRGPEGAPTNADQEDADLQRALAESAAASGIQPQGTPILDREDERFLESLTSSELVPSLGEDDNETPPPLPPRVKTPVFDIDSDVSSIASMEEEKPDVKGKGKEQATTDNNLKPAPKRFSFVTNLSRNISMRRKPSSANKTASLEPSSHLAVPNQEIQKEETDITRVLDDLGLSAQNNKTFSLSKESAEMVQKFTQVLKDLVNGVPTAYGDLVALIDDRDGIIARNYEKLPKSLKKLVTQLPDKLTSSLAPELLAVAAEAQGLSTASTEGGKAGLKGAAKNFLTPKNMKEIITKPGAIAGLLKGIVNALKTRWPAFIGTNVLWSVAVFLLLSALWYCYKRGREERLDGEAAAAAGSPIDAGDRVEELPDDPLLPAPESGAAAKKPWEDEGEKSTQGVKLPPPPVGEHAVPSAK